MLGGFYQGERPLCNADIVEALGILEQYVILRGVLFDEGAFEHQGLELAVAEDVVKILNVLDHSAHLFSVTLLRTEILRHAVAQGLGLADVDYLAALVPHNIDTRRQRQSARLFHKPLHTLVGHSSLPLSFY